MGRIVCGKWSKLYKLLLKKYMIVSKLAKHGGIALINMPNCIHSVITKEYNTCKAIQVNNLKSSEYAFGMVLFSWRTENDNCDHMQ